MKSIPMLLLVAAIMGAGCAESRCITVHLYRDTDANPIDNALIERSRARVHSAIDRAVTTQNGMARFCGSRSDDVYRVELAKLSFRWRDGKWLIDQGFLPLLIIPGSSNRAEIPIRVPF